MLFLQCGSPAQKENENKRTIDTLAVEAPVEETPTSGQETTETEYAASIDLDEFTKYPFRNDYPYIKEILKEDSIAFTLIALDTIHSEQRIIEFDNSRIEFLDSDENYQAELGDLICSSDIKSPKFRFNQDVKIGMPQEEFLARADLDESYLMRDDASGLHYYENKISWGEDEGHWKVVFWFNGGVLVRVQSEISPCYYDYGD
jgi:hypothetical protein